MARMAGAAALHWLARSRSHSQRWHLTRGEGAFKCGTGHAGARPTRAIRRACSGGATASPRPSSDVTDAVTSGPIVLRLFGGLIVEGPGPMADAPSSGDARQPGPRL